MKRNVGERVKIKSCSHMGKGAVYLRKPAIYKDKLCAWASGRLPYLNLLHAALSMAS
jgi:hypothetical protein